MHVDSVAFAFLLSAIVDILFKADLLQLRCVSRRCLKSMSVMHLSVSQPFQTPCVLRFWQNTSLVEYMCACLPHMKVRHPLHTHLKLRSTCRKIILVTHASFEATVNSRLIQLCEQRKRHVQVLTNIKESTLRASDRQIIQWCGNQHEAFKRIHDSGFLCQTWLPLNRHGPPTGWLG